MDKTIIGVDIGGTHFRIGRVGERGEVGDFRKLPVGQVFTGSEPLADLTAFLRDYCGGNLPGAVVIGFPATLDARRQTVLQAPNVPFMENLPVVRVLSEALNVPVFIERDVTLTLLYDCRECNLPPEGIVCGFYFGTGIGNAIAIDGQPLIGRDGTAGELGHIPADGSDEVCGCGNVGCLEPLAGGRHLARLCREVYRDTPIGELFVRHGGEPPLRRFVDRMAMAVATEINILNPHHILIGGGVPAMAAFPREYLLERIRFHTRKPLPAENLDVIFTDDREDKTVLGAAIYGRTRL